MAKKILDLDLNPKSFLSAGGRQRGGRAKTFWSVGGKQRGGRAKSVLALAEGGKGQRFMAKKIFDSGQRRGSLQKRFWI